jgi:hypothetical protein
MIVAAPGVIFVQECELAGLLGVPELLPQLLVENEVEEDAPEFPAESVQVTT